MATIGQKYSYGTDAPLQKNYIGEAMDTVEQNQFKYRAEQALKDKVKKEEEDVKLKEYALYDSKLKSDYTNVNNIDSKINDYLYIQKEDSAKAKQVLDNPNSTREQKIQAMSARNGTLNNIDQLDQAVKFFNDNNKNLEEGVRDGKYDQSSLNSMQKVLGAIGQGDVRFGNKNGVLTISAYERDAEGKPIKVIADNEPLGDFVRNHLTPDLKSNLEEQISKYHTEYQASSTKTIDASGTTIFHKGIDMTKGSKDWNNATEKAVGILSNEPELKRASKKYKLPITDVEGIASKLRDDLLNGVPTQDENLKNASLIFDKYKYGQENKEKKQVVPAITSITVAKNDQKIGNVVIPRNTKKVSYKGVIVGDPKKAYEELTSITVKKGSDGKFKLFANIKSVGGESISSKETKFKQSGLDKIKYNEDNSEAIKSGSLKKKELEVFDILSETTTEKQKPNRYLDFGVDATELAQFASAKGMTVEDFQEEAIRSAGYNPNKQAKTETKEERLARMKAELKQ